MERDPPELRLPDGIDENGYKQIRARMRASVLNAWKGRNEVTAGVDAWEVVDEAWFSMAKSNFETKSEDFLPHALAVARNKAIDFLRRAETKRRDRSIDAPVMQELEGSAGADVDYFKSEERVATINRLALFEEAMNADGVLTPVQREVFVAVRIDGKSRAAVGRELDPPLTGQRVGQVVAEAFRELQKYVKANEDRALVGQAKGGGRRG